MGYILAVCREEQVRGRQPVELRSGQHGMGFHVQCMRGTVKFADEIKVTSNVCGGRLGILERKKSAEDSSERTRMKFSTECKIMVSPTDK